MPSYYDIDKSGVDLAYYTTVYNRVIFKSPQKLKFDKPVFHNDMLEVIDISGGVPTNLIEGTDWIVMPDDQHDDAIAYVKSIDSAFNGVLLKSITIIKPYNSDYKVQLKFNQLYSDNIDYARINQYQELEVTPTLIGNMLEQVHYLQQMVLNSSDVYSAQSSEVKVLDEVPTGDDDTNLIVDEAHDINTIDGIAYIRTIYGAFFKDSVVIKNGNSGDALELGTHYEILEADLAKTNNTNNPSGVFMTIKITFDFVGEILVSYRAYGGATDVISVRKLHDRVLGVENFLSGNSFVTPHTLSADPAMMSINDKIQHLEGMMRLLLQNGLPSYGDVSTGTAVLKKLISPDAMLHWWSIATLYRVDGSSSDITADVFKFRIKSLHSGIMFECSVAVNVNDNSDSRISVTCDNDNIPANTLETITPKLRILEVKSGGQYSGVVLQLGMRLGVGILQETIDIEDMSGKESCWKVVPFTADSVNPEDTAVLMPDELTTYSYDTPNHLVDEAMIPFKSGLNILKVNSNIPLTLNALNDINVVDNTDLDSMVQEVGDIDMSGVTGFKNSITVNIGDPSPVTVDLLIPLTKWDKMNRVWEGRSEISINDVKMIWICKLFFDVQAIAYKMSYTVLPVDTTIITDTFNVVSTKLVF